MKSSEKAANSTNATYNTVTNNDLQENIPIDYAGNGSITIYKYDITAAEAAEAYNRGDQQAADKLDAELETAIKNFAIEGVEFTFF